MRSHRIIRRITAVMGGFAMLSMLAASHAWGQYDSPSSFDEDSSTGELAALLLIVGAGTVAGTAPFWGPIVVTNDDYSKRGYFAEYPYKEGMHGSMMFEPAFSSEPYDWAIQAKTAYAENFGRFGRIDTGLQWEGSHRIGVDTEFDYWQESVAPGQNHDFWTGDANLLFRFAQCGWLQTRVGMGVAWLNDDSATDCGFNFTYKADVFVREPLVLSVELDWGTLGDETLFHPRATIGAHWHRAELFIGCDYFDIGPTQVTSMILGGRFWY